MPIPTIPVPPPPGTPPAARRHPFVTPGHRTGFAVVVSLFFRWGVTHNVNDILTASSCIVAIGALLLTDFFLSIMVPTIFSRGAAATSPRAPRSAHR